MTKKPRRSANTSTTAILEEMSLEWPEPPAGIQLSDLERETWDVMIQVRDKRHWRDFDLFMLAKLVKFEVKTRELWEELMAGEMTQNVNGKEIANPLVAIICSLQNQQHQLLTKLRLIPVGDSSALLSKAPVPTVPDRVSVYENEKVSQLIARPK